MAIQILYTLIISLFLINQITGQNGLLCPPEHQTPCTGINQVRIDAILINGNFQGGCNCDCNPELYKPGSPKFCKPPNVLTDCRCSPAPITTPPVATTAAPPQPPPLGGIFANPGQLPYPYPYPYPIPPPPQPQQPPQPPQPPQQPQTTTVVAPGQPLPPIQYYTNAPQIQIPQFPHPPLTPPLLGHNPAAPGPPGYQYPLPPPQAPGAPGTPATPATPGYQYPLPPPPQPTVYVAPAPMQVICGKPGPCGCPLGHVGECTIICRGTPDACKDGLIECNNDGYDCFVDCLEEQSCGGSTSIMGPKNGALTVNCIGDKSCEGSARFNGEMGTDLTVICNGFTSGKGAQFNFGKGVGTVECNGDPDSCITSTFNLLPGAQTMPGAAFSCGGPNCPSYAPPAFSNVVTVVGQCEGPGPCGCQPGAMEPCKLTCNGADACKDGTISCTDGFDCIVDCMSMNACSGAANIIGPVGASLTVNCMGEKSCEGSVTFDGTNSGDVSVNCRGSVSCKGGGVVFNFGSGRGTASCMGDPDACKDAQFNLPADALAFNCIGTNCPATPAPFDNAPANPAQIVQPIQQPQPPQQPQQPPYQPPQQPQQPQPYQPPYQPPQPPQQPQQPYQPPQQPYQPPQQPQPPYQPPQSQPPQNVYVPPQQPPQNVYVPPQQPLPPIQGQPAPAPGIIGGGGIIETSPYCCKTSIPGFKPWRGKCWRCTTAAECSAEPNSRCAWDANNCHPNPPINTFYSNRSVGCKFTDETCSSNADCCSETCNRSNVTPVGSCR